MANQGNQPRDNDREPARKPGDSGKEVVGDNRGLGDMDGNRTGGNSKSPGADDPKDHPGDGPQPS